MRAIERHADFGGASVSQEITNKKVEVMNKRIIKIAHLAAIGLLLLVGAIVAAA